MGRAVASVTVMGNPINLMQFGICEDAPLGMSERVSLENFSRVKIHLGCRWPHPIGWGLGLNNKVKGNLVPASVSLCFLSLDVMGSATMTDCILKP